MKQVVSAVLFLAASGLCSSCTLHEARRFETPDVPLGDQFVGAPDEPHGPVVEEWWREFESSELDELMRLTLAENRDLGASWARLLQARELLRQADGGDELQLDLSGGPSLDTSVLRRDGNSDRRDEVFGYSLGGRLSWALDVWGRIEARTQGAALDLLATRQDVEATALLLSGSVVQAWLDARLNAALLAIVRDQEVTSRRLLDLTEFRFANGVGTALDVFQQRSQLAAVTADLPTFESGRSVAQHRLAILRGALPGRGAELEPASLPALPPLPRVLTPRDLLRRRPDLRGLRLRLEAADQRVAEAVAARLPSFEISLDYDLIKGNGPGLFDRESGRLALGFLAPILNGDALEAEERRQRAVVLERVEAFAAGFLVAVGEVEDALVRERRQRELLANVERQVELAESTLQEAQSRYGNGEGDFINVLTAVRTLQDLERIDIIERRNLLGIRSGLYLALGGSWTSDLSPPADLNAQALDRSEP